MKLSLLLLLPLLTEAFLPPLPPSSSTSLYAAKKTVAAPKKAGFAFPWDKPETAAATKKPAAKQAAAKPAAKAGGFTFPWDQGKEAPAQKSNSKAVVKGKGKAEPKGKTVAGTIFNMDLYNYGGDQYGARSKKVLKTAEIKEGKGYVPSGLTAAQYNKLRGEKDKKRDDKYKMNVAKGGKFLGYDEFYLKRGTDIKAGGWSKSATLGHRMAKTKYGWGTEDVKAFSTVKDKADAKKGKVLAKAGKR